MTANEIVTLIANNGVAVGVTIYFLYKDYKFNNTLVTLLTAIESHLSKEEKEK